MSGRIACILLLFFILVEIMLMLITLQVYRFDVAALFEAVLLM